MSHEIFVGVEQLLVISGYTHTYDENLNKVQFLKHEICADPRISLLEYHSASFRTACCPWLKCENRYKNADASATMA